MRKISFLLIVLAVLRFSFSEGADPNKELQGLLKKITEEPKNVRRYFETAEKYYELGVKAKSKNDKINCFEKGMEYAKKGIRIDDKCADAHFWYVVNLGKKSQTKGKLASLAAVPEIKKEFNRVIELAPNHVTARMGRAALYYKLSKAMGGDLNKAEHDLLHILNVEPTYTRTYVQLGILYIKMKNYEKARKALNTVLTMKKPRYPDSYPSDVKQAEKLLKEIKNK